MQHPLSCSQQAPAATVPSRSEFLIAWPLQVTSIQEMGAYVVLLEYDNIEGMILLSELSRRRIRSINKLIKVRCAACLAGACKLHRTNVACAECRTLSSC